MKHRKWIHGRFIKWNKVTSTLVKGFVYKICKMMRSEMSVVRLNDSVETVWGFCYLQSALNASGGSEMTVVAKRIGW